MSPWQQLRRAVKPGFRRLLEILAAGPSRSIHVLTYHSVDDSGSLISVSEQELRGQLDWLRTRGFRGLRAAEFIDRRTTGRTTHTTKPEVFLTFDDGYENFLLQAAPLLREFGFPATVFIVPSLMGESPVWYERDAKLIAKLVKSFAPDATSAEQYQREMRSLENARLMSWDQARQLQQLGFDIGSHSNSHRFLTTLTDIELAAELKDSREAIRTRLGTVPDLFCYPYGDCDPRVAAAARQAGYRVGFSGDPEQPDGGDLETRRWSVAPRMTPRQFGYLVSRASDWEAAFRRRFSV